MTPQAEKVLKHLQRWGSDQDSNIARVLKVPAPSVRRSIQELMHEGHHISFAGPTGMYTLAKES